MPHSEYEGGGVMPNTVFPMGPDALTASDKLRLQSITGQEDDPTVKPNPFHWYGGADPGIMEMTTEQQRVDAIMQPEKTRYVEKSY